MIKTKVFAVNPFREATYVVSDQTKECVIIDAGASEPFERERIEKYIDNEGLTVKMLINTHCHVDHILSVNYFKDIYKVPFAADGKEKPIIALAEDSAKAYGLNADDDFTPEIDIDLENTDEICFGNTTLKIIHTPGHTPGGISIFESQSKTLFTGDTLFSESIGRTDLPYGDYVSLMNSIIYNILPLGGDTTIYPGHGNHSTLAHEAMYNPFITEVIQGEVNVK